MVGPLIMGIVRGLPEANRLERAQRARA
jgi:hypothetical protein